MISRRALLLGAAGGIVAGCGGRDEEMQSGIPPWHMWGNSITMVVTSGGVVTNPVSSAQLVRVAGYPRPDTWSFLLGAKVLTGIGPGGSPISPGNVTVGFNITPGLGRTSIILPAFQTFKFQWAGAVVPTAPKWCTSAQTPLIDDSVATSRSNVEWLSAQDIQCDVTSILSTVTLGDNVTIQVDAYFAPRSHIRSEWFRKHFPGEPEQNR